LGKNNIIMNSNLSKKTFQITSLPNFASQGRLQRIKFPKGKLKLKIFQSQKYSQKISQPIHDLYALQPLETLHYHIRTHSRALKSLFYTFSEKAFHQGSHLFRLTKNCKMLKSLHIHCSSSLIGFGGEDSRYLEKLLKIHAKQLQCVNIPIISSLFIGTSQFCRLIKTLVSLKKLKSLQLSFELDMTSARAKENFSQACQLMSTWKDPLILDLLIYHKNSGMNEFCCFTLSSLSAVKNLRSVLLRPQIDRNWRNLQIPGEELNIQEQTLSFFKNRNGLERFEIAAAKNAEIVAFLPFDRLNDLRSIRIGPGNSRLLSDDDFIRMIKCLENCSKLTDLELKIEFCPTLTDLSIRYFAESLIRNFKELKYLELAVRSGNTRGLVELCNFTIASWSYILQIYESKGLERLKLNFNHDLLSEEHVKQFFQRSPSPNLKSLEVSFSSPLIRNSLADCISLANLSHLTQFLLNLRECRNLTGEFFDKLVEIWALNAPQNLQKLIIYDFLQLPALERSQYLLKLKSICPHCEITFNVGSLSR